MKSGEYLGKLFAKEIDGITLMKHGKVLGTIITGENKMLTNSQDVNKVVNKQEEIANKEENVNINANNLQDDIHDNQGKLLAGNNLGGHSLSELHSKIGFCNLMKSHPWVEGQTFKVYCITVEDVNGNPITQGKKTFKDVWGCEDCINAIEGVTMSGNPVNN